MGHIVTDRHVRHTGDALNLGKVKKFTRNTDIKGTFSTLVIILKVVYIEI